MLEVAFNYCMLLWTIRCCEMGLAVRIARKRQAPHPVWSWPPDISALLSCERDFHRELQTHGGPGQGVDMVTSRCAAGEAFFSKMERKNHHLFDSRLEQPK